MKNYLTCVNIGFSEKSGTFCDNCHTMADGVCPVSQVLSTIAIPVLYLTSIDQKVLPFDTDK